MEGNFYNNDFNNGRDNHEPYSGEPIETSAREDEVKFPEYSVKKEKKSKKSGGLILAGIISCVLVVSLVGFGSYTVLEIYDRNNSGGVQNSENSANSSSSKTEVTLNITNKPVSNTTNLTADESGRYTAEQIATLVKPSVVGVVTYSQSSMFSQIGEGSGIVMTEDGYIITNAHVIEGASSVMVVMSDAKEYKATVIGSDEKTDLAVIKIDATGLTAATFGYSSETNVGEEVIAIGNPAGLSGSVTKGIVSELNREVSSGGLNAIQTDAAINPGNSGGPLVNMYGQVIGINSSKYVGTDYEGIGFAISIDEAMPIVEELISHGYVQGRPMIGISYTLLSETTAAMNGVVPGLFVQEINENTYAASSGLQIYDIITEIDGKAVTSSDAVSEALSGKKPGDTVTLTVYRYNYYNGSGGEKMTISVQLSEDKGELNTSSQSQSGGRSNGNSNSYSY